MSENFGELSEHSWHVNSAMAVKTCQNSENFLISEMTYFELRGGIRDPRNQKLGLRTMKTMTSKYQDLSTDDWYMKVHNPSIWGNRTIAACF